MTVKNFITDKGLTYNSHTRKKTKGWSGEKKKYIQSIKNKCLQKHEKAIIKDYKPLVENLIQTKYKLLYYIDSILDQKIQNNDTSIKGLLSIRKILKTELGESLSPIPEDNTEKLFDQIEVKIINSKEELN